MIKRLIYILIIILFASCYEDKGNYDYEEINTLAVELDNLYSVRLDKDTVFTITPRLSQSLQANMENLEFHWLYSTVNHNFYGLANNYGLDTISTERELHFYIDPEAKNLKYEHYFRLNVLDKITGIEYPVNTKIQLVKPFVGSWMILHSKNTQTALGAVEYIGDKIIVTEDAYYKEAGKRLAGKPLCLGQYTTACKYYGTGAGWSMFYVITDIPREAGVYCQWKKFEKKDSLARMVTPKAQTSFNFQKVEMMDGDGSASALLISDGILYQIPRAGKIYEPGIDLTGDTKITLAAKVTNNALLYDEEGHRFAYYYNGSDGYGVLKYDPLYFNEGEENYDLIKPIPIRDGNVTGVNPNQLPADQKVLYVGAGYQYAQNWLSLYAYALAISDNNCHIYEFNPRGFNYTSYTSFNAYYTIDIPKGLNANSCFASTFPYSGILFYSSGNTVYRLDFKQAGGKATAIYTHSGGGNITRMKIAAKKTSGLADYSAYQFDVQKSLGISIDVGNGKSDFVVLNLSATGGIESDSEHYPAVQVYEDFGEIADFVFI